MALSAEALLRPLFPEAEEEEAAAAAAQADDGASSTPRVVLPDHLGWWAPLTHLFFSPSAQALVSAHPRASAEEIDAYYCGHCLAYFAEAEAATSAHRCPRCFDCPRCPAGSAGALVAVPAAATTAASDEEEEGGGGQAKARAYELRCGFCGWKSREAIGLVEEDPEFLGMTLQVAERESPQETKFRQLLSLLRRQAAEAARERELGKLGLGLALSLSSSSASGAHEEQEEQGGGEVRRRRWQLEDLERKEAKTAAARQGYDPRGAAPLYDPRLMKKGGAALGGGGSSKHRQSPGALELSAEAADAVPQEFLTMPSLDDATRADQRRGLCLQQPREHRELRPLRKPLLTKRSRRCLLDVAAGRPGILLKPNVNPLEGDSSMRAHVGKWWQKDASAIRSLPTVTVLRPAEACVGLDPSASLPLLVKITNPLPGPVRVAVVPETEALLAAGAAGAAGGGGGNDDESSTPYYLRHLPVALGERGLVLRVAAAAAAAAGAAAAGTQGAVEVEEEVEIELGPSEDEYLDIDFDEDAVDPEALDEAAGRAFDQEGNGDAAAAAAAAAVLVVQQHGNAAWLRLCVPAGEVARAVEQQQRHRQEEQKRQQPAVVVVAGVLLFLRLRSDGGDFGGGGGKSPSVVVPVCLAFRARLSSASATAATKATAAAPPVAAATVAEDAAAAAPARAPAPAPTPASVWLMGLLSGETGAPGAAAAGGGRSGGKGKDAPKSGKTQGKKEEGGEKGKEEKDKQEQEEEEGGLLSTLMSPLRGLELSGSSSSSSSSGSGGK